SLNNAGGRVEITAGQTAVITGGGQPPLVGEMSDEDIQDWLDNNPEAQLVVSALIDEQPTQIIPTKAVINQPSIYVPPATKKPTETKEPQPIITQTAMPSLVPTVTISSVDPAGSVVGEPLNITINVISSPDGPPPTGAVKVFANGSPICIAALDVEGFAFCTGGIPSVGNFNLVASYLGDTNYITAQSAVWSNYAVAKASTTVTITSHVPNPSLLSDPITFTATVDNVAPGAGTPFGSVTFADGAYNCIATSAPWTCSFTPINPGPALVTASYSGDANFNSSNSASITHEVLLNSDTVFRNASGPMSIIAACDQLYKADVLDVNGVSSVYVEYSINDNTFSSPGTFLLTKTGAFTWEATHLIATIATDTVSWRFVATDGGSNQFFFGGSTPYFPGTLLVDFYSYDSTIACP
ncbi:Ig-like domain repeat protein, partial [bacterium]|nr:Ig-like domain repeat protein [bacterium]